MKRFLSVSLLAVLMGVVGCANHYYPGGTSPYYTSYYNTFDTYHHCYYHCCYPGYVYGGGRAFRPHHDGGGHRHWSGGSGGSGSSARSSSGGSGHSHSSSHSSHSGGHSHSGSHSSSHSKQ